MILITSKWVTTAIMMIIIQECSHEKLKSLLKLYEIEWTRITIGKSYSSRS